MRTLIMMFALLLIFITACLWHMDINAENYRKAELRYALNAAIEDTFENMMAGNIYTKNDVDAMMQDFNKALLLGINSNGKIVVKLVGADMENGILDIRVENNYKKMLSGEGMVVCEKALILEEYKWEGRDLDGNNF